MSPEEKDLRIERWVERSKRVIKQQRKLRRDFWINILTGGALLFLAMIFLEIVT